MQDNNIKKAVDGISYSEDAKERIWSGISQKQGANQAMGAGKADRGWGLSGKLKAAVVLVCLVLAIMITNTGNSSPYGAQVSVYAKTSEGEKEQVVLAQGEKVELEQTQTPAGDGYTFQISMEDDNAFYTTTVYADKESFEIYQDGTYFYCVTVSGDDTDTTIDTDLSELNHMDIITDSKRGDNVKYVVYSDDKDIDIGTIEVTIYNQDGELLDKKIIQFERLDDGSMTFVWD